MTVGFKDVHLLVLFQRSPVASKPKIAYMSQNIKSLIFISQD